MDISFSTPLIINKLSGDSFSLTKRERSRHLSNIRYGLKYLSKCFSGLIYDGGPSCLIRL